MIPEPPGKSCPPDGDVKPRTDEATTQIDLAVLSATGDVPDWIVENGLEERERADRPMNVTMNSTPKMRGCR